MENLNSLIEHTNLKANATKEDIDQLCGEAIEHKFYGVCVSPYYVKQAARKFKAAKVPQKVISVIGFPMGYSPVSAKVEEIKKAIMDGVHELDVVINLSAYLSGDMAVVKNDIQSVVTACHLQNRQVKIILETGALNKEQMLELCHICVEAGADFIKTSTGFIDPGATVDTVAYLRSQLPEKVKIKASAGIKDKATALALIEAGAKRIGTSSGIKLIKES